MATTEEVATEIIQSEEPVQESTKADAAHDQDATGGEQQPNGPANGPMTSGETANKQTSEQQTPAAPVQQQQQLQQKQTEPQEKQAKRTEPEATPAEPVQQHLQPQKQTKPEPRREPDISTERHEEILVFSTPTLPVRSVVVFLDRAEVARTVQANVRKGEHEIILKNLSHAIDKDSIR